jgi:hypothetical protein
VGEKIKKDGGGVGGGGGVVARETTKGLCPFFIHLSFFN